MKQHTWYGYLEAEPAVKWTVGQQVGIGVWSVRPPKCSADVVRPPPGPGSDVTRKPSELRGTKKKKDTPRGAPMTTSDPTWHLCSDIDRKSAVWRTARQKRSTAVACVPRRSMFTRTNSCPRTSWSKHSHQHFGQVGRRVGARKKTRCDTKAFAKQLLDFKSTR